MGEGEEASTTAIYTMVEANQKLMIRALEGIDHRFDGLEQRLDDMREAHETDFGLVHLRFSEIDEHLGRLDDGVERIELRTADLSDSLQALDGRVQGLETSVRGLDEAVRGLDGRVHGLETRVQGLEGSVERIDGRVQGLEEGVRRIEERTVGMDGDVQWIRRKVDRMDGKYGEMLKIVSETREDQRQLAMCVAGPPPPPSKPTLKQV